MTRSIRWISSSAPSPLFSSGCVALPQPRSRMALAADTRAAGVASSHRMMPTRTRMAVRVWLRARERISTRVLATLGFSPLRFSRPVCGSIGVSDSGILRRRAESNGREIRWRVVASGPRDELNDFGAHENSSDTAMTTRPTSASDIR